MQDLSFSSLTKRDLYDIFNIFYVSTYVFIIIISLKESSQWINKFNVSDFWAYFTHAFVVLYFFFNQLKD